MKPCKYRNPDTYICTKNVYSTDLLLRYGKVCVFADADGWGSTRKRDVL